MSDAQQTKGIGKSSILVLPNNGFIISMRFLSLATWSSPIVGVIMFAICFLFSPVTNAFSSFSFLLAYAAPTNAPIDVPATATML